MPNYPNIFFLMLTQAQNVAKWAQATCSQAVTEAEYFHLQTHLTGRPKLCSFQQIFVLAERLDQTPPVV
jgi:hypothetical protein